MTVPGVDGTDGGPVILRAWAPWCHNCRALAPIVEAVAADRHRGRSVPVVDVRVDEEPGVVDRFAIRSVPTLVATRDGVEVGRLVGAQSEAAVRRLFAMAAGTGTGSSDPTGGAGPPALRGGVPGYLLAGRLAAGLVLLGAGTALGRSALVVIGAILVGWALWGAIRR